VGYRCPDPDRLECLSARNPFRFRNRRIGGDLGHPVALSTAIGLDVPTLEYLFFFFG